jgi:hypothetical protein
MCHSLVLTDSVAGTLQRSQTVSLEAKVAQTVSLEAKVAQTVSLSALRTNSY